MNASLDLVEYIETKILPRYADFDRAHNLEHVTRVIRRSLDLVKITGADVNMVYTIAAPYNRWKDSRQRCQAEEMVLA